MSKDEMAGWHHRCNGHELGQTPGDGEGQRNLLCCSSEVAKSRTQLADWTPVPSRPKSCLLAFARKKLEEICVKALNCFDCMRGHLRERQARK